MKTQEQSRSSEQSQSSEFDTNPDFPSDLTQASNIISFAAGKLREMDFACLGQDEAEGKPMPDGRRPEALIMMAAAEHGESYGCHAVLSGNLDLMAECILKTESLAERVALKYLMKKEISSKVKIVAGLRMLKEMD